MIRATTCAMLLAFGSTLQAQQSRAVDLRGLLRATVRVEVVEKRFTSVLIDSVANSSRDAGFVNSDRRLFSYLVEHQLLPETLHDGVALAERPADKLIENLLRDSAAVRRLGEYRRAAVVGPLPSARSVTEAQLAEIGARFYFPMIQPNGKVVFYRCAGVNGISELGPRREPTFEAFAFWAIAPTVFDADTASERARALNSRFRTAADTFRAHVANASTDTAIVARARAQFYAEIRDSRELQDVLREAYLRSRTRLPFVVAEWGEARAK